MHADVAAIHSALASVDEVVLDRTGHLHPWPPAVPWWGGLQHRATTVTAQHPDHAKAVAHALRDAILRQPLMGPYLPSPLADATMDLLVDELGKDLVQPANLDIPPQMRSGFTGSRHLDAALFQRTGPSGAAWWRRIVERSLPLANSLYQDMAGGTLRRWPDQDWPDRIDVLADVPAEPRHTLISVVFVAAPPDDPATHRAITRLVAAHATEQTDHLLRTAAERIGATLDGSAADVDRFDWSLADTNPTVLRWLLELAGPAGTRERLVMTAVAADEVSRSDAMCLLDATDRPAWADQDIAPTIVGVHDVGLLRLPPGGLSAGDPWWTGTDADGFPYVLDVPPGEYAVRALVASHPFWLTDDHAALLVDLDPDEVVAEWRQHTGDREGFVPEVGVVAVGGPAAFDAADVLELDPDHPLDPRQPRPARAVIDSGPAGTLPAVTVNVQHPTCRTWTGHAADGRMVRVLIDLETLAEGGHDPARLARHFD